MAIDMTSTPWQDIHRAKKDEQGSRIPLEWKVDDLILKEAETVVNLRDYAIIKGLFSAEEIEITNQDATDLALKIAKGTYSSVQVVTAFCKRCAIGQQLCNYLTEIMFLPAIEEAKRLDKLYQETGKTTGPLHGIPMTVKVSVLMIDIQTFELSSCFLTEVGWL
jgi:amidase